MKLSMIIAVSVIFIVLVVSVVVLIIMGKDPTAFVAFLPSLASIVTVLFLVGQTNKKVDTVQKQTNGTLATKDAQIAALTAALSHATDPQTAATVATTAVVPETLKASDPTTP